MASVKRLKPQTLDVLGILQNTRSLTPMMASTIYRIGSLSSRISELRRAGYSFETEIKWDAHGRRYKEYRLTGFPKELCDDEDYHVQCPHCDCWKRTAEACT